MTREEAIEILKDLWRTKHSTYLEADIRKALDMAINALTQECVEPTHKHVENTLWMCCDDAISRQAVQDYIAKYLSQYLYNDVREAVEVIDEYIGELPSVTPQPKTGHWIRQDNTKEPLYGWYFCSECNSVIGDKPKFCSNCGAKMEDKG